MKKFYIFPILISFFIFFSCNNDDDNEEPLCCINYDFTVFVKPENVDGDNLLDTGGITAADIQLFYKIDDEWEERSNQFDIIEYSDEEMIIKIFASDDIDANNQSETKLIIKGTEQLITSEFYVENGAVISKIWLNGEVVFDASLGLGDDKLVKITI